MLLTMSYTEHIMQSFSPRTVSWIQASIPLCLIRGKPLFPAVPHPAFPACTSEGICYFTTQGGGNLLLKSICGESVTCN